jgi:hypothetical protein
MGVSACSVQEGDGALGTAEQPQTSPAFYQLYKPDGTLFGAILASGPAPSFTVTFTPASGGQAQTFAAEPDQEYWFVDTTALSGLKVNSQITFQPGQLQSYTAPSNWQGFWNPEDSDDKEWGTPQSSDPYQGLGPLLTQATSSSLTSGLRLVVQSNEITQVVWYQAIPSTNPNNLTPTGGFVARFSRASMISFVPSGWNLYYVALAPQALPPPP